MILANQLEVASQTELLPCLWKVPADLGPRMLLYVLHLVCPAGVMNTLDMQECIF
jgi:hypothetical protein